MVREQVCVPRYATSNLPSSFLAEHHFDALKRQLARQGETDYQA